MKHCTVMIVIGLGAGLSTATLRCAEEREDQGGSSGMCRSRRTMITRIAAAAPQSVDMHKDHADRDDDASVQRPSGCARCCTRLKRYMPSRAVACGAAKWAAASVVAFVAGKAVSVWGGSCTVVGPCCMNA